MMGSQFLARTMVATCHSWQGQESRDGFQAIAISLYLDHLLCYRWIRWVGVNKEVIDIALRDFNEFGCEVDTFHLRYAHVVTFLASASSPTCASFVAPALLSLAHPSSSRCRGCGSLSGDPKTSDESTWESIALQVRGKIYVVLQPFLILLEDKAFHRAS